MARLEEEEDDDDEDEAEMAAATRLADAANMVGLCSSSSSTVQEGSGPRA